jgi:hypothetical protein
MRTQMKTHDHDDRNTGRTAKPARQARLHSLLFTGEALGTTLASGAAASPKIPPFVGE